MTSFFMEAANERVFLFRPFLPPVFVRMLLAAKFSGTPHGFRFGAHL